ncbi:uncharacterized protein BDW43DRAFT_261424 [Aspergillus alliaceus]|uniref:uncharacterized protein n=1 Tax=Petromyces alliaceus TaxID=209559 RepID=UPI0012A60C83|nr:uncharacterized protein BDW43DRAFT_261424 [Aspergillus alliaceus]KAB8238349.1 hypothetical protein BDW43DRAFT_261424 [Aspergillus alliaceus]
MHFCLYGMRLSLDFTWDWTDRRAGTLILWMVVFLSTLSHMVPIVVNFTCLTFVTNPAICFRDTRIPDRMRLHESMD